jgi:hypothetical protein
MIGHCRSGSSLLIKYSSPTGLARGIFEYAESIRYETAYPASSVAIRFEQLKQACLSKIDHFCAILRTIERRRTEKGKLGLQSRHIMQASAAGTGKGV